MSKEITIKLHTDDMNTNYAITFKQLYEQMQQEIKDYEELGMIDELINQTITIQSVDLEGNIVDSYLTNLIGWCDKGDVVITGNVRDVY